MHYVARRRLGTATFHFNPKGFSHRCRRRPEISFTIMVSSVNAAMSTSSRTYNDAIDALNSLQTPFAILEERRKAGIKPNEASMAEMRVYLNRIGRTPEDLNRLNMIHVAGTKGKGSTCAFTDSILSQYRQKDDAQNTPKRPLRKTGLFISPHLIAVRERIRINSAPISEALFARYFFEVWDLLSASPSTQVEEHPVSDPSFPWTPSSLPSRPEPPLTPMQSTIRVPAGSKPIYARYLTLLCWHVFLAEGVDVCVIETGIGGAFDATNLVPRPVATGITALAVDHVFALGDTVERIAWHKAGIMKVSCPAFTVEQSDERATAVLKARAEEVGVGLTVLGVDKRLDGVKIRPDILFQRRNATLAVELAEAALGKIDPGFKPLGEALPQEFVDGLEKVVWRGRCEVKREEGVTWFLDGAHTIESLRMAAGWFKGEAEGAKGPRVMIFNQQGRTEAVEFLKGIYTATKDAGDKSFDKVVFCTNVTFAKAGYKRDFVNHQYDPTAIAKLTAQRTFAAKWSEFDPSADVSVAASVEEAIDVARSLVPALAEGETVQAFITGSLHLVGGALELLEGADAL